ncbi:hypothetical protein NM688_g9299 [Phlebia brevispora]|uniref:Uncharacterized protein n=1 Tax=Phlebia brevispora TaxID=194682 RepID=A0ACC1RIQ3_9APHY|nr:hypothetical protein NM688_g9299 [Phlebia brevispora]
MDPALLVEEADLIIRRVKLPYHDPTSHLATKLFTLTCRNGAIFSIVEDARPLGNTEVAASDTPSDQVVDGEGKGLLMPSLCHGHIHLDKCYLLAQCDELITGDFAEALRVTADAKASFPSRLGDLYSRGRQLILASMESGVTMMRAHVEVDDTVRMTCLETGLRLKREFAHTFFAQDPLFPKTSSDIPGENWDLLRSAAMQSGVEVIGSAPYVEPSTEKAKQNILLILDFAQEHHLHADFHLDYNLNVSQEPLVWFLLESLRKRIKNGTWRRDRHVCVGHATHLTLWTAEQWSTFAHAVAEDDLPISLVGLPQSDLYMMGRDMSYPPRSTLNPVKLARDHGLRVAMAVNNVGNAFTPQGAPDPLALCPLGMALFQTGTKKDCATLIEAVTVNARHAIGSGTAGTSLTPQVGDPADFVLLHDNGDVQAAACNPCFSRTTVKAGRIVSRREGHCWHLGQTASELR